MAWNERSARPTSQRLAEDQKAEPCGPGYCAFHPCPAALEISPAPGCSIAETGLAQSADRAAPAMGSSPQDNPAFHRDRSQATGRQHRSHPRATRPVKRQPHHDDRRSIRPKVHGRPTRDPDHNISSDSGDRKSVACEPSADHRPQRTANYSAKNGSERCCR